MDRIIYTNDEGNVSVVIPSDSWTGTLDELAARVIDNAVDTYEIVDHTEIPVTKVFRNAWKRDRQGKKVGVGMVKAKNITHGRRRRRRDIEMEPHDRIIARQVPGEDPTSAEAERVILRTKYARIQTEIDAATTPDELETIIATEEL